MKVWTLLEGDRAARGRSLFRKKSGLWVQSLLKDFLQSLISVWSSRKNHKYMWFHIQLEFNGIWPKLINFIRFFDNVIQSEFYVRPWGRNVRKLGRYRNIIGKCWIENKLVHTIIKLYKIKECLGRNVSNVKKVPEDYWEMLNWEQNCTQNH